MHARLKAAMVLATVLFAACAADSPLGGARASTVTMRFRTPATVQSLIVEVTGPGIDPSVVLNIPVGADTVATGSLTLPSGSARRFVVTAVDTAGVQTHRADTTITLQPGANPSLAMRLEPLPSMLGITVTFGGVRLVVPDTSLLELFVGDSANLYAYALLPNGDSVPPTSLSWSSTNPAFLTVVEGRAIGSRDGMAAVVVSHLGASVWVAARIIGQQTLRDTQVGDTLGGGIVAHLFQSGDAGYVAGEVHGIIAAFDDSPTPLRWGPGVLVELTDLSNSVGLGRSNTDEILRVSAQVSETFPAAQYTANYVSGRHGGWLLPSLGDLLLIKENLSNAGQGNFVNLSPTVPFAYWSSSLMDNRVGALALNFQPEAGVCGCATFETYSVRPVRYF